MNGDDLLNAMHAVEGLPFERGKANRKMRTIYLAQGGGFYLDFAAYPGGTTDEVPRRLIDSLVSEGILERAFGFDPECEAWVLKGDQFPGREKVR